MSGTQMEIEDKRGEEDLQLLSGSDTHSCSSSILNTPERTGDDDEYDDDDNYEDSINVTLLSVSPTKQLPISVMGQPKDLSNPEHGKRKNLSGAGQKRFKRLLDSGHSRQEALSLAQATQKPTDLSKRPRHSDLNVSGNPRPLKIPRQNSNVQQRIEAIRSEHSGHTSKKTEERKNPSYKDVVSGVKVGILPSGYPNVELTTQQLVSTQKAILCKVAEHRKDTIKPKFGNCAFKSGYLVILCKNQETAVWLKTIIPTLKPWADAKLIAVEEKNIPRPEILIGFFPWSSEDSNNNILELLEGQNNGLVVDAWRILQRNAINQHVELIFTVDGVSMNTIKKNKFKLDYKFGNAQIREKFKKNRQVETTEQKNDPK